MKIFSFNSQVNLQRMLPIKLKYTTFANQLTIPITNVTSKPMALRKAFQFTLIFAVVFVLFSCNQSKSTVSNGDEIEFDSMLIRKQKHLFNDTAKASATIELDLLTPESTTNEKVRLLIEKSLKIALFGKNDTQSNLKQLAQDYVGVYLKEYNQLEAIYLKDQEEFAKQKANKEDADSYDPMQSAYSYEHNTNVNINYNRDKILSFTIQRYDYTGGAHGMTTDSCFNLLIDQERFLKQEDLFDESSLDKIAALIVNQIAKENKVEKPEKLEEIGYFNVSEIYPNGNILVSKEGVTWIYNPYDIAAYAIGSVVVTIPFADLKQYLKANHPIEALLK